MKHFFKHYRIIPFLLTLFFVTVPLGVIVAHAQTNASISGDDICGSSAATKCTLSSLGVVAKNVLRAIIVLGTPALLVFASWRFLVGWYKLRSGAAADWAATRREITNAVGGFLLIVALFGGLLTAMLKFFGVKDSVLQILNIFSSGFIEHAYAQASSSAATSAANSPFNVTNSSDIYDFLLSFLRLVMRFVVYPGLIVMWVWTGFGFVLAQGNPEALMKSRRLLLTAALITAGILFFQTFLLALQGSVQRILPGASQQEDRTNLAPAPGAPGSACDLDLGNGVKVVGRTGTNGTCYPSGRGNASGPVTSCNGQLDGTPCRLPSGATGACGTSEDNVFSCYVSASTAPTNGTVCDLGGGVSGQRGTDGVCRPSSRGATTGLVTSCNGQVDGTPCRLPSGLAGACGTSDDSGVRSCYVIVGN
jgi:hypothetical protein